MGWTVVGTGEEGMGREGKESLLRQQECRRGRWAVSVDPREELGRAGRPSQPSALTHHAHLQILGSWYTQGDTDLSPAKMRSSPLHLDAALSPGLSPNLRGSHGVRRTLSPEELACLSPGWRLKPPSVL